jgi:kynurenine formamidase
MFEIIDLTKWLDENLTIYSEDAYSDPPLQIETWSTVQEKGFKVSRLTMGTQTGTHIDAPSHFVADGDTLEMLPLQALIGHYMWIDLDQITQTELAELITNASILFLTCSSFQNNKNISEEVFEALLKLPCLVWVIVVGIRITGHEPMYFHKKLAETGKYLIEDVDETAAMQVKAGGEMIALPLRLRGTSGSPCRVLVKQNVK